MLSVMHFLFKKCLNTENVILNYGTFLYLILFGAMGYEEKILVN